MKSFAEFEPGTAPLKDGRLLGLRRVRRSDAQALLELERAVIADGRGVVKGPDELPKNADGMVPGIEEAIALASIEGIRLVGVLEGRVIAEATASRLPPALLNHVAVLGLQVHPDAQGLGAGRATLDGILRWAEWTHSSTRPVRRLELYVRRDNERALGLYRSAGFEQEGVRRGLIRLGDGTLVDDCVMGRVWQGPLV